MTIVCYKVGDTFTKSFKEAIETALSVKDKITRFYYERTDIDDIDKIRNISLSDLEKAYSSKEVKNC